MLSKEQVEEWQKAKKLLDKYKAEEGKLRKLIVQEVNKAANVPEKKRPGLLPSVVIEDNGKGKIKYWDDKNEIAIQIENKKTVSVDESVNDVFEDLSDEERGCFEEKLQFYPPRWAKLIEENDEAEYDLLEYITEKPATPTVTIIKPKSF